MKTQEQKIQEILEMPFKKIKEFKSIRECANALGYANAAHVRQRVAELGLGVSFSKLGINSISAQTILLSPEDFETLKESLGNKRKAGRKPARQKEEKDAKT